MTTQSKDDVHISWTQIREFEIRCPNELNFEFDEERNTSKITWEALLLPGFTPKISDIFLYGLRNGKIGLFRVTQIQRLALGQDSYFKISFDMQEFLTPTTKKRLSSQSTSIFYFDKVKFMVGNHAMLTSEGFIQQKDLTQLRSEIIQNYMDRFYSPNLSSFIRPDDIYDPYVVEYWNKKVSYLECSTRPVQILVAVQNYKKTIWSILTNNPIKQLPNLASDCHISLFVATFWGTNITSLLGKKFLTVGNDPARKLSPNVNKKGEPILLDTTPFFHTKLFDKLIYDNAQKYFEIFQKIVYYDYKHHCQKCTFHKEDDLHTDCHKPHPKYSPPYPIVSTEELFVIWKKLHRIPEKALLTQTAMAKFRGYVRWYRQTYPGTYSRHELERIWREKAQFRPDQPLLDREKDNLIKFITDYRSKYKKVLSDTEIETIWRKKYNISKDTALTQIQQSVLAAIIKRYRKLHGYPPDDGFTNIMPITTLLTMEDDIEFEPNDTTEEVVTEPEDEDTEVELPGEDVIIPEDEPVDPGFSQDDLVDPDFTVEDIPIDPDFSVNQEEPIDPGFSVKPEKVSPVFLKPKHPHRQPPLFIHPHPHHHHHKPHPQPRPESEQQTVFYALSREFYNGSIAMDPFERLLYNTITNQAINPQLIIESISRYLEWSDEDAFYRSLFALYLIDKAQYWIRFHS